MAELESSLLEPNTVMDPAVSAAPPLSNEAMNQRMADIEFRIGLEKELQTSPLAEWGYETVRKRTGGDVSQIIKYLMSNVETGEVRGDDPEDPIYGTTRRGTIRYGQLGPQGREGGNIRVQATDRMEKFGEEAFKRGNFPLLRKAQDQGGGDQVLAHELAHMTLKELWDQGEADELKVIFGEDVIEVMDFLRYADMEGNVDPLSAWAKWSGQGDKTQSEMWGKGRANYPAVAMAILTQGHDQFDGIISLSPYEQQLADLVVKVNKAAARKLTEKGIRTEFPTSLSSNSLSAIDKYMTNYWNYRKSTQMIDPNTVYTDPQAQAAILMGEQTPEKTQIASKLMETLSRGQGLPQAMESLNQPPGVQTAQAMPPSAEGGGTDIPIEQLLREGLGPEEYKRQKEFEENLQIGNWLLINEREAVPWAPNLTWGEYLDSIRTAKGPDAVDQIIKDQIKQEEGRNSPPKGDIEVRNLPTIPAPQAPQVAAGRPVAPPQGIMAAAEGGLVPPTAPIGEGEFMQTLQNMAQEAGIDPGAMETVAQNIEVPANDNVMDSGIMQTVEAVPATEEDLSGIGSLEGINRQLVDAGKEGLVHAAPGELIFDPSRLNEPDQRMLLAALETAGIDPDSATVGNAANILNEMTGLPAFGFFSKVRKKVGRAFKKVGKFLKNNAGTILGIAGAMTGNPWLAALGSGIGSLIEGKGIKGALISAGMSFVATKWVGPWLGEQIAGVIPSFGTSSVGEALGAATPTMWGGQAITKAGISGMAGKQVLTEAGKAATNAVIEGTSAGLTGAALQQAGAEAALQSMSAPMTTAAASGLGFVTGPALATQLGGDVAKQMASNLATEAIKQTTGGVFRQAIGTASQFMLPGPGIGSVLGTAPSYAVGTPIEQLLGTSVSSALGGAAAGAAQSYAEPMIQNMMTVPGDQEADVMAAWNERYNYTPSPGDLYAFYTDVYLPNQQINVAQTIGGTPGYEFIQPPQQPPQQPIMPQLTQLGINPIVQAAGGGYINGMGTPKSDSNLALVSNGEFVMTEAATRGADPLGLDNRMRGAQRMYDSMKELEARAA